MVFKDSFVGIADEPDQFVFYVVLATDIIMDFFVYWVEKETVDCEVSAFCIFCGVAESYCVWTASVGVAGVTAESCDFKLVFIFDDCDDAKSLPYCVSIFKKIFNL